MESIIVLNKFFLYLNNLFLQSQLQPQSLRNWIEMAILVFFLKK